MILSFHNLKIQGKKQEKRTHKDSPKQQTHLSTYLKQSQTWPVSVIKIEKHLYGTKSDHYDNFHCFCTVS